MDLHANGKLLLTGEYFVLDGALALALPTRLGQRLSVNETEMDFLHWYSYDHNDKLWFSCTWEISMRRELRLFYWKGDEAVAQRIEDLFNAADKLTPCIWDDVYGHTIHTHLEFPADWGLGSSSTLVSMLADYLNVDAYALLEATFGGSGYDLACAKSQLPILYQRANPPQVEQIDWRPFWAEQAYFVHLGHKQDSREGIRLYKSKAAGLQHLIPEINQLTNALVQASDATEASAVLRAHEELVAGALGLPMAQQQLFGDFPGQIKSLGAWGGDFVLAISPWDEADTRRYFDGKAGSVLGFNEMRLPA